MSGKIPKWPTPIVIAILLVLGTAQAHATTLNPGGNVVPDNIGLGGNFTILDSTSSFFTTPGGTSGFVLESVVKGDTNNTAGGLDFVYEFVNTSGPGADPFTSLSSRNFTGFSTDVSQVSLGGTTVGASSVSRTTSGDEVTWNFTNNGLGTVGSGDVSDVLIVRTNASGFVSGNNLITITDGGGANVNGFSPSGLAAIPEPSSLVLLGSFLVGLGGAGAWRRRRKEAFIVS